MPSAATIRSCVFFLSLACERLLTHFGERFFGAAVGLGVAFLVVATADVSVVSDSVSVSVSLSVSGTVSVSVSVTVSDSVSVVVSVV